MRIIIPLTAATLLFFQGVLTAQTVITHPSSGVTAPMQLTAGKYTYFDSGGPNAPYGDNETGALTICPTEPNEIVRVNFDEVDLEIDPNDNDCVDVLEISGDVNGRNGDYCGSAQQTPGVPFFNLIPGITFESLPGQCLTFSFNSDPAISGNGWAAQVDVRAPAPCNSDLECGENLICESFESFANWGIVSQSAQWKLRNLESVDGMVTDEAAATGTQSLRIETINNQTTNIAVLLGNQTEDRYRLSWKMFIPTGSQGRYTLQHREALNHWAFEVKLAGGAGALFIPNDQAEPGAAFSYTAGEWVDFVHIFDLNTDQAELWVGGQFVHQWQFSLGDDLAGSEDVLNQLGAATFTSAALYYLDDLALTRTGCPEDQCEPIDPCPVTANNRQFSSQCQACCAGYTFKEWEEESDPPMILSYSDQREWVDQGEDITLMNFGDGPTLFIDSRAVDTIDFRESDVILSNYCPDKLRVEVEDTRPIQSDAPCYNFKVIWRVMLDDVLVDSDTLPVISECKQIATIDTIIYLPRMDTLLTGDTLKLANCPMPDSADFKFILNSCPGKVDIGIRRQDFTWIGDISGNQQDDNTPCFYEAYRFNPSQCNLPGPAFDLVVEVVDMEKPELIAPPDTSIACLKELEDPMKTGMHLLVAVDSCGIRDTTFVDDLSQMGDECTGIVQRTWTLIDSCGNRRSKVQRIIVQDTVPPTFKAPDPLTINGEELLGDLQLTGQVADVADNCSIRDTTYSDDLSGLTECVGRVIRTWTITDNCGNAQSLEQTIFVRDVKAPTMRVPADVALNCPKDLDDPLLTGTITRVRDNIGIADTLFTEDRSGLEDCQGVIIRTWTVTDSCGNKVTGTQAITLRDTIPPTFVAPFQVTINCIEELQDTSITGSVLFVNDNCGIRDTMYRDSTSMASDCVFSIWRTWTIIDNCGNSSSKIQRIQMADTEPPQFEVPSSETVSISQLNDLMITGNISNVTDNCNIRDTSYSDVLVREATCDEEGWVIRTWMIEDWCGNTTSRSQDIFFTLDRPEINAGRDTVVSCQVPTVQLGGEGSSLGDPYVYAWTTDDGNILSGQDTPFPTVNAAGTYLFEIRDTINGCNSLDEVVVIQDNDLMPNLLTKTDIDCFGDSTGVIVISPVGGVAPYSIRWSSGDTTTVIDSLSAGQYTVSVSDNGNCETISSFLISGPDSIDIGFSNLVASSCSENTGQATVKIMGGSAPYELFWENGEDSTMALMLGVGPNSIMVRDTNGCVAMDSVEIGKDIPEINILPLPGLCDGSPPLPLIGATPAGGEYFGPGVQNGLFDPTLTGEGRYEIGYAYSATNGCMDTVSTLITVNALPSLTDMGLDPVCESSESIILDFIQPVGGIYSGPGINRDTLRPGLAGDGNYPILYSYRDSITGCTNSLASLITIEPAVETTFEIEISDTTICESQELEVSASFNNGGEIPEFLWEIPGLGPIPETTSNVKIKLPAGSYQVKGSMISELACVTSPLLSDSINLRVDSVFLAVTAPAGDTVCADIGAYVLTGASPAGGMYIGTFIEEDSLFQVGKSGPGVFPIQYVMTDTLSGCPVSASFDLTVEICTGTDPVIEVYALSVYPNPARAFIQIAFDGEKMDKVWLELWDSQGRNVRQQLVEPASGTWSERLETDQLPSGVYFLSIRNKDARLWRKVIIQR